MTETDIIPTATTAAATNAIDSDNQQLFYQQMEQRLKQQIIKCQHYEKYFEEVIQNPTLAQKFRTYALHTNEDLTYLKLKRENKDPVPRFKFEIMNFSCLPVNTEIEDKQVQIIVKSSKLPDDVDESTHYIIAEFDYPYAREETPLEAIRRWFRNTRISPSNFISCLAPDSKQYDMIHPIGRPAYFAHQESDAIKYSHPLTFYVEKGRSKSHRRKFKMVKLNFYQKTGLFEKDRRFGTAQFKIDRINDQIMVLERSYLQLGTKKLDTFVDLKVGVREPLTDKSIRSHEEKILVLVSDDDDENGRI